MATIDTKGFTGRFFASLTDALQADGAQNISTSQATNLDTWQAQVELSSTPTAGSLEVAIRSPGANDFVVIDTIDLTAAPSINRYTYVFEEIRFTPSNLDAGVTYAVYLNGYQD